MTDADISLPYELEEKQGSRSISLPVVRLAEHCLDGQRDGLFEVHSGLDLLRALSDLPDHIEAFNEQGTEKLIGILLGVIKGNKVFCPALLRYRATALLYEVLRFSEVGETVLDINLYKLHNKLLGVEAEEQDSRSRSRSQSKEQRKKEKERDKDREKEGKDKKKKSEKEKNSSKSPPKKPLR